ncbi:ERD (early-responsive to dehydration stress)family protein [Striga asiatica]|uniref:ERD (Early-responsive to dehydration stress)family protein n=1 Tax=Striga asiatica TaxID=4170 RepID=A0A5A7QF69_STRAF|nr:ERD (early-responsive to dehydration stress)family protein [Striga asiatica]
MSSLSQEIPSSAMRSETQIRLGEEGVLVNRGAGLGNEELDSANFACLLVHFFPGWWVTGLGRGAIASGGVESEKSMGWSTKTVFGFWKSRSKDLLEALVLSSWSISWRAREGDGNKALEEESIGLDDCTGELLVPTSGVFLEVEVP